MSNFSHDDEQDFFRCVKIYLAGYPTAGPQDPFVHLAYFNSIKDVCEPQDLPRLFEKATRENYTEKDGKRTYRPVTAPALADIAAMVAGQRQAQQRQERLLTSGSSRRAGYVSRGDMLRGKPPEVDEEYWLTHQAVTPADSGLNAGDLTYGRKHYERCQDIEAANPGMSGREVAKAFMESLGGSKPATPVREVLAKAGNPTPPEGRKGRLEHAMGNVAVKIDPAWKGGLGGYLAEHSHGPMRGPCPEGCPAIKKRRDALGPPKGG